MRDPENIREVAKLKPDFMGFIFYPPSPRYVSSNSDFPYDELLNICTVGVFVNELPECIADTVKRFNLKAVQLHGNETPDFCKSMKERGLVVLKAISIETADDLKKASGYAKVVDYIVLDTKTKAHGGSGRKFNWQFLEAYAADVPFLLGGGIAPEDVSLIKSIHHSKMAGLDLNSRFECEPGIKDLQQLKLFSSLVF